MTSKQRAKEVLAVLDWPLDTPRKSPLESSRSRASPGKYRDTINQAMTTRIFQTKREKSDAERSLRSSMDKLGKSTAWNTSKREAAKLESRLSQAIKGTVETKSQRPRPQRPMINEPLFDYDVYRLNVAKFVPSNQNFTTTKNTFLNSARQPNFSAAPFSHKSRSSHSHITFKSLFPN